MRISPQRHTLAVLRNICGLSQKYLANLLECSTPTVQAVELGKLKLSVDLAQRVHFQTGVSPEWLLANDVTQPPLSSDGKLYTKTRFEEMQAALLSPKTSSTDAFIELWRTWHMFMRHVKILAILYAAAYERGKVPHVFYKGLMSTKECFEKTVGEDKAIEEKLAALPGLGIDPVWLFELDVPLANFEAETVETLKRKLKSAKTVLSPVFQVYVDEYEKRILRAREKAAKVKGKIFYVPLGDQDEEKAAAGPKPKPKKK